MPVEVTNVIRRNEAAGKVTTATANRAFADLLVYPLVLLPYEPFARRVWELRRNVTSYDAWYVAIAEYENAELVTLDARLARASGPICTITVPT